MRNIATLIIGASLLITGCAPTVAATSETQAKGVVITPVSTPSKAVPSTGQCPQTRKTPSAPSHLLKQQNPHSSPAVIKEGEELYQKTAKPFACKLCHGAKGDGLGDPDFESTPPARNFTCKATMESLADGQLFWVIKRGSPSTSMPGFGGNLSDDDIWKIVAYLRTFSK